MPLFDFRCEKCDSKEERLVKRDEYETQVCKVCEEAMVKVEGISNTSFALKGVWFRSHNRY